MPKITFLPEGKTVSVRSGTTLLAAAHQAGVAVRSRCSGMAGCLMCKVKVLDPGAVSAANDAERRKMGAEQPDGLRLACQTKALHDCAVELPEDPLKAAIRKQLARQKEEDQLW